MTTPATSRRLTRNERLDRLPFTKKHGRMLFGSGVGWALDAMDVGLISFVMAALAVHWDLDTTTLGFIGSIGFVGMAIGATFGGLLADKIGRRQVFAVTLLIYGIATGASALATGVGMLIVLRFIVGLGLGAELPVASTLISEFAPKRIRGRVVVWLEAFWAVGWIAAACIGTFVIPLSENGWRWGFAIGLVPAAYAIVIRFGLPESVRFLESKGRLDEAEHIVRDFENSAGIAHPTPGPETQALEVVPARNKKTDARTSDGDAPGIWSKGLRRRTSGLWIIWFCINLSYYGAFIWIPSLLVAQGFDLVKSFTFTLIITLAQLPGYAVSAWLIEAWGRRATLATFMVGSAGSAVFFGLATTEPMIITAGCMLSFFNLGAWGALYAIGPELYPTDIRGTGTGAAAGFGRIASIISPFIVPLVIVSGGPVMVFAIFGVAFLIAACAVFLLPELKGASLQQ
ncbi:MFS transporter [Agrococcus casei]|uniref:Niacin transporter NiaP n=1 Tax=Agrococcus casei LMG 22410 TaxID=1255656 RepID=A0A1R4GGN3_9MICO|nr:MFS transporter [Agrococcus casei]SJM67253.1 Niacin transporter NiaP [Agrococcus casei LMG 22410]